MRDSHAAFVQEVWPRVRAGASGSKVFLGNEPRYAEVDGWRFRRSAEAASIHAWLTKL